jgi:enterochelin esterase-like enzyme
MFVDFPRGRIEDKLIYSEFLREEIKLLIYLPDGYSELNKYPLLIAQDGKDYFQFGRIGRFADELIHQGEIEPLIIVGVPYNSVDDRRKKYHPNGELQQAYIHFLVNELTPLLDREFSTLQVGMGRTLIGDSLGATVSLMTALRYPHTFGTVLLQSPFVNLDVMELVQQVTEPSLHIYHVIGKKETEVKTTDGLIQDFLTPNRELSQLFQKKGFPYFYDEFEGNHTWKFWQPDLKRALKHMYKMK